MAAKKQESLFWRILISAVGAALIFMSVSNLLLFFLGETATAAVETRRYGGERFNAPNDKRYSWYVDYTFRAEDGVLYEGHLSKLGSATSVIVDNTIYYFPFAPFINTTAETAAPNFGQLVLFGAGVVLIAAVNQRRRPRRTKAVAPRARTLTDYDDSVESTFPEEVEMSNFCTNCGAPLEADARFCTACGTPVAPPIPPQAAPQQAYQAAQQQAYQAAPQQAYQAPQQQFGRGYAPLVGWTQRHMDPQIVARAEKNKKAAWGFTIFLTIAFPVGFTIAGFAVDDMPIEEAVIIGFGLGIMMLIIGLVRIASMKKGIWEGTVVDKYKKNKIEHTSDDSTHYRMHYTIVVKEEGGKSHKLNYVDNAAMYDYFNVGDRIRCHQAFGTYEKYDKSRDSYIFCNVCGKLNDITNDTCVSCHMPLFK